MASKTGALFSAADAANEAVTLGDRRPSTVLMIETSRSLAYLLSIAGAISVIFLFGPTVQLTGIEIVAICAAADGLSRKSILYRLRTYLITGLYEPDFGSALNTREALILCSSI